MSSEPAPRPLCIAGADSDMALGCSGGIKREKQDGSNDRKARTAFQWWVPPFPQRSERQAHACWRQLQPRARQSSSRPRRARRSCAVFLEVLFPSSLSQHRREHGDGLWETRVLLDRLQLFLESIHCDVCRCTNLSEQSGRDPYSPRTV